MNSTITFPPVPPTLKLTRSGSTRSPHDEKWAATLNEERRRLLEDQEALRVREMNLREYESRLRALQAEIEAGSAAAVAHARVAGSASVTPFARPSSKTPFETDAALQAAWEKLHRAREILEAEQAHMRDERIISQEQEKQLKSREDTVTEREVRVVEREKQLAAFESAAAAEPIAGEHTMSAVGRLTRMPFDVARSVFGGKK